MPKFGEKTMSKIGKLPVRLPEGTAAEIVGSTLKVTGPKGALSMSLPGVVVAEIGKDSIVLSLKEGIKDFSTYGTTRATVANMVHGVSEGWSKQLELVGTGYRAEVAGSILTLTVGYSHPIKIEAPEGITFKVEKTIITIEGPDRELVGQVTANIRAIRPPEPYKGKGIKYKDEVIRRKAGKAAKAIGAPGAV